MLLMRDMPSIKRDFVASKLRFQVNRLNDVLRNIEEEKFDPYYADNRLREVEVDIRGLRKLYQNEIE
ncbi:MAG: hypothetical protein HQL23_03180 [Candidatus Omnitrophica bacterium]|nr:hypothetical protein [Candidatus Omnitrophota bacterium]